VNTYLLEAYEAHGRIDELSNLADALFEVFPSAALGEVLLEHRVVFLCVCAFIVVVAIGAGGNRWVYLLVPRRRRRGSW
jgi:hypothetical protein